MEKLYIVMYYNSNDERDFETIVSAEDNYTNVQLDWLRRYNIENQDNQLPVSNIIDCYDIARSFDDNGNGFVINLTREIL